MYRQRVGNRRHVARIEQHDGTLNGDGHPTYTTPGDWDTYVSSWPCEMLITGGGEVIRGRQVSDQTTAVFFGEYYGVQGTDPKMRISVGGVTYGIVSAYDADGDNREMRIEAKKEGS